MTSRAHRGKRSSASVSRRRFRWPGYRYAEERRPLIEAALLNEVVDRGYANTTILGVCKRAGVEERVFTDLFDDVDEAYCDVLDGCLGQIFEAMIGAFAEQERWRERIRAVAYAIHDFIDEDRRRARFMMIEIFNAGERAQLMRTDALEILADVIDGGRTELEDPDQVSRITAEALAGTMYREAMQILERDEPRAYERLPHLIYSVVLPYVGFDEAQRELDIAPPQAPDSPWLAQGANHG